MWSPESLLEHDHVALDLVSRSGHDVERLVQSQLLSRPQGLGLDGGVQPDLHLATVRQDIDGVVRVCRQVYPVAGRRRAQLVDLFPERRDLVTRFAEGVL